MTTDEYTSDLRARLETGGDLVELATVQGIPVAATIRKLCDALDETITNLARVSLLPHCRDTGHTEMIHSAVGCCDPYTKPCEAYLAGRHKDEAPPIQSGRY